MIVKKGGIYGKDLFFLIRESDVRAIEEGGITREELKAALDDVLMTPKDLAEMNTRRSSFLKDWRPSFLKDFEKGEAVA